VAASDDLAAAERRGDPYIVYDYAHGSTRVLSLPDGWHRVTIGRGMAADIPLTWDPDASRVHAELVRVADAWVVVDDGLSRNGTFVNGERVERRQRLLDGDELRIGSTAIRFRAPFEHGERTLVDQPRP
jgi:pSer/pThr/pTyr-binding forkhead associated (FHA) protein